MRDGGNRGIHLPTSKQVKAYPFLRYNGTTSPGNHNEETEVMGLRVQTKCCKYRITHPLLICIFFISFGDIPRSRTARECWVMLK